MPFGFRIESLSFSKPDDAVRVLDSEVVVIIGPNNCGKSQALRDIDACLRQADQGLAIKHVAVQREGDNEEIDAWLRATNAYRHEMPSGQQSVLNSNGNLMPLTVAGHTWSNQEYLGELANFLVLRADAETRLQLVSNVPSINPVSGEAIFPLQRLISDHKSEARLFEAVQHAFDIGICVNRAGGSELALHLGRPIAEPRLDSPEYLAELKELPLVASQGDGMRSFIGLILTLAATDYPVVLIDEPEAFLHPPQARELGHQLAAPSKQQRFIATHSADVLLGLLDSASSLAVIRLRRRGNETVASVLDHERIQMLWRDPSFRYSNLLDGLFHSGVVICEAEGDARLYAATLDDVRESNEKASSDLLFTECGGKHKLPTAIDALRPLGVPVCAIADLDVLRDRALLQNIVVKLGGTWDQIEREWNIVAKAVDQMPVLAPVISDVRQEINDLLGTDLAARLSEDQTRRIKKLTKTSDGWRQVREAGGALPRGQAASAGATLLSNLEKIGLFVVPVGALEQWDRSIGNRGTTFVEAAFGAGLHEQSKDLREFMGRLDLYLAAAGMT
jgi:energy-coupling factor transporter ATP-binding protein EcfA2